MPPKAANPQLGLFEPRPAANTLAHGDDPASSHDFAGYAARSGKLAMQRRTLLAAITERPGLTSAEYADELGMDKHDLRRRLTEMKNLGTVRRGHLRTCSVGPGRAATWWLPGRGGIDNG